MIQVYRSPEEVFSKASMASFECKIVTDNHPPNELTPDNAQRYSKGVVTNVRKGKSQDEEDLLLADLVIYDERLIRDIESGKTEVSCGYSYVKVENEDGSYSQVSIRGNHVAIVDAGRAGKRVSIKDQKCKEKESEVDKMPGTKKYNIPKKKQSTSSKFLQAIGLKHLAMDAEPEELSEIMDEVSEEYSENKARDNEESTKSETQAKGEDSDDNQGLAEEVKRLTALVESLMSKDSEKEPEEAIDDILGEIESNDEKESEVIEDERLPDADITDPDERPVNPIASADKAWIPVLKDMKRIIAGIPDKEVRQKATDSLVSAYKKSKKAPKRTVNGYEAIANSQQRQATDSINKQTQDIEDIGEKIAREYNANMKGAK